MNTEIFDTNKMYRFNKKLTNGGKWTELCDGLIVEVESENLGKVKVNGNEYTVFPRQCNLVEVNCISRKEGNCYKEKLIIEDIIKKIDDCFTDSIKEDPYFTKYSKGYTYVFDVMSINDEDKLEPWMFEANEKIVTPIENTCYGIVKDNKGITHNVHRENTIALEVFQSDKQYQFIWDFLPLYKRIQKKYKLLKLADEQIVKPISEWEAEIEINNKKYIVERDYCMPIDE